MKLKIIEEAKNRDVNFFDCSSAIITVFGDVKLTLKSYFIGQSINGQRTS